MRRARIHLAHQDAAFAERLAAALQAEGHEVVRVGDQNLAVPPPGAFDGLEIAITQATAGRYQSLRIRVTGIPKDKPYAGALGQLLAEPVDVERAIAAVKLFLR